MSRDARITRGTELQRIAREGKRIRTTHLDVRVAAPPFPRAVGAQMRVGLVVPRFSHTAVARNRLKRRLRELTRLRLLPADLPADVVVRTRPEAYDASFDALATDVAHTLDRLTAWSSHVLSLPREHQ